MLKARRKDRLYAIKALIKKEGSLALENCQYELETEILKRVKHPRIPRLVETFSIKEVNYIVQEYIEGPPLSCLIDRGVRFTEAEVKEIIVQLLMILNALHAPKQKENAIVHRDLRLSNILLSQEKIYLIDFGLARFIDSAQFPNCPEESIEALPDKRSVLESQKVPGCETYRLLRREISPRSDLFGVGVVAIDLFTSWVEDESQFDMPWQNVLPLSKPFIKFLHRLLSDKNSFQTASEALCALSKINNAKI